VTTTLGWAAAIWCARGALIDLSDWVVTLAWTSWEARWEFRASGLQGVLHNNWTGHAVGQKGREEGENVDNVKVHVG